MQVVQNLLEKYKLEDKVIAVGVSGGADSLALVLTAKEKLEPLGKKIVALTVDHGLRPHSAQEAQYVAQLMAKFGIEHHILKWNGAKPTTAIEETARKMRYKLISDWCLAHNISCVMMAHHLQDQAETFLMRLQRGSGLSGLCAIREFEILDNLIILRPLLSQKPEELKKMLRAKNLRWVEDESNADEQFLRNKIRKFLPILEQQTGISAENIYQTTKRLQSAEDYIRQNLLDLIEKEVVFEKNEICHFSYKMFKSLHSEMQFRLLAHLLKQTYIPRAESVLHLKEELLQPTFRGATLGAKEILLYGGQIWLVPEVPFKRKAYRQKWAEFILKFPQYAEKKIPPKAKAIMVKDEK